MITNWVEYSGPVYTKFKKAFLVIIILYFSFKNCNKSSSESSIYHFQNTMGPAKWFNSNHHLRYSFVFAWCNRVNVIPFAQHYISQTTTVGRHPDCGSTILFEQYVVFHAFYSNDITLFVLERTFYMALIL